MKTKKMLLLFFGVKGLILLAPLSFIAVHYMVNSFSLKNKDIDTYDNNGYTPLMYVAQQTYIDGVRKLIIDGAQLDLQSKNLAVRYLNPDGTAKIDGSTALHMACLNLDNSDAMAIIRLLVYSGANARIKTFASGQTPLFTAAYYSKTLDDRFLRLAELLIKNGADINATDVDGNTILHYAVENRRADWLTALLGKRFGALVDREIKNKRGLTALDRAKELRLELMTEVFDKNPLPPTYAFAERDPNGLTGAMIAVIRGDTSTLKKMQKDDIALDERSIERDGDEYGYTALHFTLLHERLSMIELLLEKGAHPELRDKRGLSFIHKLFYLTSLQDRKEVVDIIAKRSNLNIQDISGNTLLHHAVLKNDYGLIKYLLARYGSKVSLAITNNNFDTPVDLARRVGTREVWMAIGIIDQDYEKPVAKQF